MSEWHEIKSIDDFDISLDRKSIEIWVTDNKNGNVYATIEIDMLLDFLKGEQIIK